MSRQPRVSVICEVAPGHPPLEPTLLSLLTQEIDPEALDIIIAPSDTTNASTAIPERFTRHPRIRVVRGEGKSRGAVWSDAVASARHPWIMFASAGDRIDPSFIAGLLAEDLESASIICGATTTMNPFTGEKTASIGIQGRIDSYQDDDLLPPIEALPFLITPAGKLFHTSVLEAVGRFEDSDSAGGFDFWLLRFRSIPDSVAIQRASSTARYHEALTSPRRSTYDTVLDHHPSRVHLELIDSLGTIVLDETVPWSRKQPILRDLHVINQRLSQRYWDKNDSGRRTLKAAIDESASLFLNRSMFSAIPAIAFCHNFPPSIDASSMVASKRLAQIAQLYGSELKWQVITADMGESRPKDYRYLSTFVNFNCASREVAALSPWFNEKEQHKWGVTAAARVMHRPASVIYSRSMHPGSHVAAYRYKMAHPDAVWFAEFSDPLSSSTSGERRAASRTWEGEDEIFNTWWQDLEADVLRTADTIIFTNENQMRLTLDRACTPEDRKDVEIRSLSMAHPLIDPRYARIDALDYRLDSDVVNVGYFGTFYPERSPEALRQVLADPHVVIHVFSPENPELDKLVTAHPERIRTHRPIPYLQFLNLAGHMDYLFAQDTQYPGELNPYLPSKIADYRSVGTPIIVDIHPGSPLDRSQYRSSLLSISEFLALRGVPEPEESDKPDLETADTKTADTDPSGDTPPTPVLEVPGRDESTDHPIDQQTPPQATADPASLIVKSAGRIRRRLGRLLNGLGVTPRSGGPKPQPDHLGAIGDADTDATTEGGEPKPQPAPSITAIMATYRPIDSIYEAVDSVLNQDYPDDRSNVVISTNGPCDEWTETLRARYKDNARIQVIHTPILGPSAARNLAIKSLQSDWFIVLDDDDYLTPGYLKELAGGTEPGVSIVCGRLVDRDLETGEINEDTYINRTLVASGMGALDHYYHPAISSHFSNFTAKLYRTSAFKKHLKLKNESVTQAEDVIFWVENAHRVPGRIFVTSSYSKEAYVRNITEGSRSRPEGPDRFRAEVLDRIAFVERFGHEVTAKDRTLGHRRFAMDKLIAQLLRLEAFLDESTGSTEEQRIRGAVAQSDSFYLSFGRLSEVTGLLLTDSFPPQASERAEQSAFRLQAINSRYPRGVNWTAVTLSGAPNERRDEHFWHLIARHMIGSLRYVNASPSSSSHVIEARMLAALLAEPVPDVIASIGARLSAHKAAQRYKQVHREVRWVADLTLLPPSAWTGGREPGGIGLLDLLEDIDEAVFASEAELRRIVSQLPASIASRLKTISTVKRSPKLPSWYTHVKSDPTFNDDPRPSRPNPL